MQTGAAAAANSSLDEPLMGGGGNAQVPGYVRQLPQYKAPYQHLIEMYNKKTCKRRIIALDSVTVADEYVTILNLVNSFLTYEQLLSKDSVNTATENSHVSHQNKGPPAGGEQGDRPRKPVNAGPVFITNWVKGYIRHQGIMDCQEEYFEPHNFPYLLAFGRETEAIRGLVFGEAFRFLGGEEVDALIQALTNTL
jgi:hypothetical protein